ncbi:MAG: hypothetical protein ACRCXE_01735, partial [Metamycoplasmataceae bacterium]
LDTTKIASAILSEKTNGFYTITLTTVAGYVFNDGNNTLVSNPFTINTVLDIEADLENMVYNNNQINVDSVQSAKTLKLLFSKIDETNFENIASVTLSEKIDGFYSITLIAHEGFVFGDDSNTLVSKPFTINTVLDIQADLEDKVYNNIEINTSNVTSVETLKLLFSKINETNILNIASITLNEKDIDGFYSITLIAHEGFVFGDDSNTLVSKPFTINTVLDINIIPTANIINDSVINPESVSSKYTSSLQNVFSGIDLTSVLNIKTAIWIENADGSSYKVLLTAKEGFVFGNNTNTLESQSFILKLEINANGVAIVEQEKINDGLISAINTNTLGIIFDGVLLSHKVKIEKAELKLEAGFYKVVLTAKKGFVFGNNETTLSSNDFRLKVNVSKLEETLPIFNENQITEENINDPAVLALLFSGINASNVNLLKAKLSETMHGTLFINLVGDEGYVFANGSNSLNSNEFKLIVNKIIADQTIVMVDELKVNEEKIKTKTTSALKILFAGLTLINIDKIDTATWIKNSDSYQVTITTKTGYVFSDGSTTLTSKAFTLNLEAIIVNQDVSIVDASLVTRANIEKFNMKALRVLFDINISSVEKLEKAELIYADGSYKVVLTAKTGNSFEGSHTLSSLSFNLKWDTVVIREDVNNPLAVVVNKANIEKRTFAALRELFDGITSVSHEAIENAEWIENGDGTYKVTLTAKAGNVFSNGLNTLTSIYFTTLIK